MNDYKVGVITGERKVEIREFALHQPEAGQVLIKVDSCAVCTLEQRIYRGIMKSYPFAGGHEMSGTVVATGKGVKSVTAADKVAMRMLTACGECYYCRSGHENQCVASFKTSIHGELTGPGGFAEYMLVDVKSVYKLEDEVDLAHAALSEPLACCVHSVEGSGIRLGDDVVIIGAGIMGLLHVQLSKLRGARVIACEIDSLRLEKAKDAGADIVIDSKKVDPVKKVKELTGGRGANVVFCTAAPPELAAQSVAMAGTLGRVVFYSSIHPDHPIEISANKIHSTETVITGSINPNTSDFLAATRLLSYKLVDVSSLISETVRLNEIDRALERAIDPSTYRVLVKCS